MACTELVTLIKDLILSGAAIFGAFIANKGLNTWKRQMKGQSEYELLRRLLVTLFKYRDTIAGVRYPVMWEYEKPKPPEGEAVCMSPTEIRFYGTCKAYQARWDKVQIERTSLYADLLESEAFWGDELKKLFKTLFDLQSELFISIQNNIELMNPKIPEKSKKAIHEIHKQRRDIMYDDLSEEGDDYRRDFQCGVEAIESYLKRKLRH